MKKYIVILISMLMMVSLLACESESNSQISKVNEIASSEIIVEDGSQQTRQNPTGQETFVSDEVELDYDSLPSMSYPIVDTNQTDTFSDKGVINTQVGDSYYGQDGDNTINEPSYTDNGDGIVNDNITGLMWQQTMDEKMYVSDVGSYAGESTLGGYTDWRLPTIKELFSLIDYNGISGGTVASILFIDEQYFDQPLGDTSVGEREIDAQVLSGTKYVSTTMNGDITYFGVNFIDGRIKGYGVNDPRSGGEKTWYFRLVRGNENYGENNFVDNNDGTITDNATGLMWQATDDGQTRDWEGSLSYAQGATDAGYDDWRLPTAKELQSIVDYTKSPSTSDSPAIDDVFTLTSFINTMGNEDYGYYWTSTTHLDGRNPYDGAIYVAFGEALGQMNGKTMDVHGAGAIRSDPKTGDADEYPQYFGPQGDERRVYN